MDLTLPSRRSSEAHVLTVSKGWSEWMNTFSPFSLKMFIGPASRSRATIPCFDDTRGNLRSKYLATSSWSNWYSDRASSPMTRASTFLCISRRSMLRSSMSTMSETPTSITLCASGDGTPENGMYSTRLLPASMVASTSCAFSRSMTSVRISE